MWSIIQQGLLRFPYYYQHTGISNALSTHTHSVSLHQAVFFTLSPCLVSVYLCDSPFMNLTTAHMPHTHIHHIHSALLLAVTLCNKSSTLKWKFGNGVTVPPNSMKGWGSEVHRKKACLIIFLITPVTIPKLFFTESAGEYANRQCCAALVCWAWA